MKKVVITVITLAVVGFIGYKGKSLVNQREDEIKSVPLPTPQYVKAKLYKAKTGNETLTKGYVANVESQKSIKISTKLAGKIKKIFVQESQEIKRGKLLVKIDESEILSNLKALKSNLNTQKSDLEIAKKIYQRNIKLFKVGALPKEKLELSSLSVKAKQSAIANTKSKIAQIQNQLTYLNIKAPFDGAVDALLMHEGDLAVAGKPILAISSNQKKLLITFNKDDNLKEKDEVYYKQKNIGSIKSIYKVAKNGLNVAEIKLNKEIDALPGSTIEIKIKVADAKGCIIPQDAILQTSKGVFIYEYSNSSFTKVKINPLVQSDKFVVIKSCPKNPIAIANQTTLASLIAYQNVQIIGDSNASR